MNIKENLQILSSKLKDLNLYLLLNNYLLLRRSIPTNASDHGGIAKTISLIERNSLSIKLNRSRIESKAQVIILIGAPGSGKSTLLNTLITKSLEDKKKIAALVLDPRSKKTGGSFLGDRLRLDQDFPKHGVYIRSMSFRNEFKDEIKKINSVINLFRNLNFEIIFMETVGNDQNNVNLAEIQNTTIAIFSDSDMDWVQTLKSDNIELADQLFINIKQENSDSQIKNLIEKIKFLRKDIFDANLISIGSAKDLSAVTNLYDRIMSLEIKPNG